MKNETIKIIAFGDIIGRPGRHALKSIIPAMRKKHSPDLIIANGENLAHNEGITEKMLKEVMGYGVDFVTLGDHTFDQESEMVKLFSSDNYPMIRPANFPPNVPGRGWKTVKVKGKDIAIMNLMGRVFFREILDCPFRTADALIEEIKRTTNIIICDFHAEATSEKKAMGCYLDGRVSLVYGTHTHIPTADEQILPKNTAYTADIGMTGPNYSVIGSDPERSIKHFLTQMPFDYEISSDKKVEVNGIIADIDLESAHAVKMTRFREIIDI